MIRYKLIRYRLRHIVIEHIVIFLLDTLCHLTVGLHLCLCPVLEILTDLVDLVGTGCCGILIRDGLRTLIPFLPGLADGDCLVGHGGLDELCAQDGLVKKFTLDTHCLVLLLINPIRSFHIPCTASRRKGHVNIGLFPDIFLVELRIYPRRTDTEINKVGGNVKWLFLFQFLDIDVILSVCIVVDGLLQLLTDVATEVFVGYCHFVGAGILKPKSADNDTLANIFLGPLVIIGRFHT